MSEEQQKVEGGGEMQSPASEQQVSSEPKSPMAAAAPMAVTQGEKMWGVLAYLPLVSLMTLVVNPKSEFCKLHGTQGLVLFGIEFLSLFLAGISPAIIGLLWLVLFVLVVFAAFKAFSGEMFKIPGIYDLSKMIPVDSLVAGVNASAGTGSSASQNQAPVQPQAQPEMKVEIESKPEMGTGVDAGAGAETMNKNDAADSSESGNNEN